MSRTGAHVVAVRQMAAIGQPETHEAVLGLDESRKSGEAVDHEQKLRRQLMSRLLCGLRDSSVCNVGCR